MFKKLFGKGLILEGPTLFSEQEPQSLLKQFYDLRIFLVGKQGQFLLRVYQAEFDQGPNSNATESSRSNMIALQHTVRQMYGEAVARDVASLATTLTR